MAFLGCSSSEAATPSSRSTSSATNGTREAPPTRSTLCNDRTSTPASSRVACSTPMLCATNGSIISSSSRRVRRTASRPDGSDTLIVAAMSVESASLAATTSSRTARMMRAEDSASGSRRCNAPSRQRSTKPMMASSKSIPPKRSRPRGSPRTSKDSSVLRSTAASKVPPPRSYTATTAPVGTRS
ncbi:MAG: hypothetical protein R2749_01810 [Acidimicrobiales bacterium]